jgi:hypothetical protein
VPVGRIRNDRSHLLVGRLVGDADVTEGSAASWKRLHYDWSDPNRVFMETTNSNT